MRRGLRWSMVGVGLAGGRASIRAAARACSLAGPTPYTIDAVDAGDRSGCRRRCPPLSVARLQRGKAREGCSVEQLRRDRERSRSPAPATDDVTPPTASATASRSWPARCPRPSRPCRTSRRQVTVSDGEIWFTGTMAPRMIRSRSTSRCRSSRSTRRATRARRRPSAYRRPGGACAIAPARASARRSLGRCRALASLAPAPAPADAVTDSPPDDHAASSRSRRDRAESEGIVDPNAASGHRGRGRELAAPPAGHRRTSRDPPRVASPRTHVAGASRRIARDGR